MTLPEHEQGVIPSGDTCNARTRAGSYCQRMAGDGTDHLGHGRCVSHGGNTANGRVFGHMLMVQDEARRLALPIEVDHQEALAELVKIMSGQVLWYTQKLMQLGEDNLVQTNTKTGMLEPSVWVLAHASAVDRLARVSKMALDAGVAERKVRIMEEQGRWLINTLDEVFGMLDLTPSQVEALPAIMLRVLSNVHYEESTPILEAEIVSDSFDQAPAAPAAW